MCDISYVLEWVNVVYMTYTMWQGPFFLWVGKWDLLNGDSQS